DECHDQSYKQQDSLLRYSALRYNARDMAIVLGKIADIPVLLGSATPLLESWRQIEEQKWHLLSLANQALSVSPKQVTLDDQRETQRIDGFSLALMGEINRRLLAGEQVLLFLNRRGYAPALICRNCDWQAMCSACDSRMVAYLDNSCLQCHHCGRRQILPISCPACGGDFLELCGIGTQRLEQAARKHFPYARILRIDTDSAKTAKQFNELVERVRSNAVNLIIGTQWLSKGHHFPNLNLVAVMDADSAFYSGDFRAQERLAQLLVQVGGRAGREKAGHIWIQTQQTGQKVFAVLFENYRREALRQLKLRQEADLPPYSAQTLLLAIHPQVEVATKFLLELREEIKKQEFSDFAVLGPVPALMLHKDTKARVQLLFQSSTKQNMQKILPRVQEMLEPRKKNSALRVFFDVDPMAFD
ncbi:MAG: primosomal protein N', partial [Campylobacter sp.]|nr:primosomal protein N' [Campylobacter sp.]